MPQKWKWVTANALTSATPSMLDEDDEYPDNVSPGLMLHIGKQMCSIRPGLTLSGYSSSSSSMDGVADVNALAVTHFHFWGMGEPQEESARGQPLALPHLFFVEAPHSSSSCGELASGDNST